MHELSIALSIVDGALEELERHGADRAEAVHLRLGRLSGVDREALLFSYRLACEGTKLNSSRLQIEDVEVTIFCPSCGTERSTGAFPVLTCADCGTVAERLIHGQELEITAMEIAA
ncbi:MAG TPA: hydrogenase maturation nickel metallochaperone HypA [Verrucomicrobiae bacterium]|nr:hydrogenase maturation nickel metallochaperone HypA [Verrucomicrobiae bacterium]